MIVTGKLLQEDEFQLKPLSLQQPADSRGEGARSLGLTASYEAPTFFAEWSDVTKALPELAVDPGATGELGTDHDTRARSGGALLRIRQDVQPGTEASEIARAAEVATGLDPHQMRVER